MKIKKRYLFLLALLSLGYTGWNYITTPTGDQVVNYTPAKQECFAAGSERPWKYCIYTAAQGVNGDIAYQLHGRNLSEQIWNDDTFYSAMMQKYFADQNIKPPTVVTVSFGPVWLLAPKNQREKSGLLDLMINEVISTVEQKTGAPKRRLIFGESMGGTNSLVLALNTKNLFAKAGILCPGIYKISPFAPISEVQDFLKRTGADPKIIYGIRALGLMHVSTMDEWKAISPVELVETVDPSQMPEFYLSAGLYDKYGNYEGAEYFQKRARERGLKVQWRPIYGGHCTVDVASVSEFLVN
ncbi:alpha/beta hydrolase-fold protein [Pseudobdellovibrio sp. HCB154]|uniref:alpha/beta hydrolase-fold protein n=1 Tax=Pseudobdellovibrio sp. HCB154 TaxID=3386277 RepID=UPI003917317D